jgi:uncharacterized iron-regulated membrane protein
MAKRNITTIHSFAGFIAGVFILFLSVSGSLLVFHNELDSFQKPVVLNKCGHFSTDACYATVKNTYPLAEISSCSMPAQQSPFSFFIYDSVFDKGASAREIFVDPCTAKITGSRGGSNDMRHNFMGWLSKFHNSFGAGKPGEWLLAVFAVVFVLSLITGIILYRKSVFSVLFFKQGVYSKKNLHQIIGVYALLFNLMMGISGYWMQRYVFKKDFYTISTWVKTLKPSPQQRFSIDAALAGLKKQHPSFTPYVIYFAQNNQGKTAVYGSNSTNSFIHSKKFADVIALDSSGAISKTRFINANTTSDYYDIINSQLHMGKYGGWFIKLLYGLFGITGAVLSITGFMLWRKRKNEKL